MPLLLAETPPPVSSAKGSFEDAAGAAAGCTEGTRTCAASVVRVDPFESVTV